MKHFFVLNLAFYAVFFNFSVWGNTFCELCWRKPCIPTHLELSPKGARAGCEFCSGVEVS